MLRRSLAATFSLSLLLAAGLGLAASPAQAAVADASAEASIVRSMLAARASAGVGPLSNVADLAAIARSHSAYMADTNQLVHNGALGSQVQGWVAIAENVAFGASADGISSALMASAGHRANILGSTYTQVGVGAARSSDGRLWVTQVFRTPDASTAGLPVVGGEPSTPRGSLPSMSTEPGVVRTGDSITLSERGADGRVSMRAIRDGWVGAEQNLGGSVKGAAAIASDQGGDLRVVARGTDDQLWVNARWGFAGGFGGWSPLGGAVTGRPASASWGIGRFDVVARGTDGQVWHRYQSSRGGYSPWQSLGGQLAPGTGPAIASSGPGQLTVAVTGVDNQIWARSYGAGGWGPWTPLGGVVVGDPSATSRGGGDVVIAVKGTDSAGWVRTLNSGWLRLGGVLATSPSLTAAPGGRVDVLGVGTDAALYRAVYDGAWGQWARVS